MQRRLSTSIKLIKPFVGIQIRKLNISNLDRKRRMNYQDQKKRYKQVVEHVSHLTRKQNLQYGKGSKKKKIIDGKYVASSNQHVSKYWVAASSNHKVTSSKYQIESSKYKVRYLVSFKILGIFKILFWKFGILKASFLLKSVLFCWNYESNDKIQIWQMKHGFWIHGKYLKEESGLFCEFRGKIFFLWKQWKGF